MASQNLISRVVSVTKHRVKKLKLIITWGILFLLCGSIALNVFLYKEVSKFYTQLYASELDPIGLSYFQHEVNPINSDKQIVVFYGDSRAAQWPSPQINGFYFVNRGIGNQTSTQVILRFEEHVQPLQPDIVIIQVCINDLKTIPLFPGKKQEIIDNCKANIIKTIQKSLAINSTVILTTIFPTSGNIPLERRLVWSKDIYDAINEVNQFILNYQDKGVIIFDTAHMLSNSDGNMKPEYIYDLLHINNTGYEAINTELIKILETMK